MTLWFRAPATLAKDTTLCPGLMSFSRLWKHVCTYKHARSHTHNFKISLKSMSLLSMMVLYSISEDSIQEEHHSPARPCEFYQPMSMGVFLSFCRDVKVLLQESSTSLPGFIPDIFFKVTTNGSVGTVSLLCIFAVGAQESYWFLKVDSALFHNNEFIYHL